MGEQTVNSVAEYWIRGVISLANPRLISGVLIVLLIFDGGMAQETSRGQRDSTDTVIQGRVVDARTGDPLPAVNVFLSNTTRGTTTDTTGQYALNLEPGSYELVVSMVGYESQHVNLDVDGQDRVIRRDFQLVEKVFQQEEITVRAPENTTWWNRYRVFKEQFLGSSANADQTTIENPYPIEFELTAGGTLVATCDPPLTIVNRALGYRIRFHLREFAWNKSARSLQYLGWTHYQALDPESEQQAEQWAENRQRAYRGSLRHLMRAMIAGETQEEGFYLKPAGAPVEPLGFRTVDAEQFIAATGRPYLFELSFEDTLRVIYVRSGTDGFPPLGSRHDGKQRLGLGAHEGKRISAIHLKQSGAQVHKLGYLYDPRVLVVMGAMGYRRVADALPKSYVPSPNGGG